jgi:hypothetical protein
VREHGGAEHQPQQQRGDVHRVHELLRYTR